VALRQGEIYWIADCPPLHGSMAAPHAVIILNPAPELKDAQHPLNVVVVSSSVVNPGTSHIPMPNKQTHDPCSTCFTKPCWAVTEWILQINDRAKLASHCGYIGGRTLRSVLAAYLGAIASGKLPIAHPPAAGSIKRRKAGEQK